MSLIVLEHKISAANCPFCGAYSSFTWGKLNYNYHIDGRGNFSKEIDYYIGECNHCKGITFWDEYWDDQSRRYKLIYPIKGLVALPNEDLPEDIKNDYKEASEIVELSPRGSVALLRLAVQKLCKHLGEKGENINGDIKALVQKGLNPMIQQALDAVRVTGNNAVHPGTIDLRDDRETAIKVFGLVNVIADVMITQPKLIKQFYDEKLTNGDKVAIEKRDSKQ